MQKHRPIQSILGMLHVTFLYSLKTSENLWFSEFSGSIEMKHWVEMG